MHWGLCLYFPLSRDTRGGLIGGGLLLPRKLPIVSKQILRSKKHNWYFFFFFSIIFLTPRIWTGSHRYVESVHAWGLDYGTRPHVSIYTSQTKTAWQNTHTRTHTHIHTYTYDNTTYTYDNTTYTYDNTTYWHTYSIIHTLIFTIITAHTHAHTHIHTYTYDNTTYNKWQYTYIHM